VTGWKCLVMFEKGYSRTIASESIFIGKQVSGHERSGQCASLVQKRLEAGWQAFTQPSLPAPCTYYARAMAFFWLARLWLGKDTILQILRRGKATFRACSQANRARSPQPISGRGTCAWHSAIHRRHSTELKILVLLQYLHSSIYRVSFSHVHH